MVEKLKIKATFRPTTTPISLEEIESSLLINLKGNDFIPTQEHGEQLEQLRQNLPSQYKESIKNFYLLNNITDNQFRNCLLLLDNKELLLLKELKEPFDKPTNLETTLLQRYETVREGIQKEYEYLYQVESGKGIMSLGGLIVHPMKNKAEEKMEEKFSKLEDIPTIETKELFKDYLEDRYRFVKYLPYEGDIDRYINIEGGRKDCWDMLSYYKKLLEIRNNHKYDKIYKYANTPNYNQIFFDGELLVLDPRYEFMKRNRFRSI